MTASMTIDLLRRYAIARTFVPETSLKRALARLGFVQADPIRAPARAQDLVLRHRVRGYRTGALDARYPTLDVEEDFFVNYGFVRTDLHALMHPRDRGVPRTAAQRRRTAEVFAFVRRHGAVHPRDVARHFDHGSVTNYWGGSSSATTHLMEDMHYRGLLRVVRREGGIRVYAARDGDSRPASRVSPEAREARLDALVDAAVRLYAPVPQATLAWLVGRMRIAAPQWRRGVPAALRRAKTRLAQARVEDVTWYWPADEAARVREIADKGASGPVRLLAPFDPLVWDRRRFERFWGWAYRFEAYTPRAKRQFGYYALPLLNGDAVPGWATLEVDGDALVARVRFAGARSLDRPPRDALSEEIERICAFLGVPRIGSIVCSD